MRRAEESVPGMAAKATEVVDQVLDKRREFIRDTQAILTEAVKAGHDALSREREPRSRERNR